MSNVSIVAGPCSVDEHNVSDILEIAKLCINGKKAVAGTRVVGLKSRTAHSTDVSSMGMDYETYKHNLKMLLEGNGHASFITPPSLKIMQYILEQTKLVMATEVMNPLVQIPPLQEQLKANLLLWNPSVNQLGWQVLETAHFANKNNWHVGIKNGKWVGTNPHNNEQETSSEKTWKGLVSYATSQTQKVILIHRGFDVEHKGEHRNLPLHQIAINVKKQTNARLFFDPSHSFGPKLRDKICHETLKVLGMQTAGEYVYDGILIETGTSRTDTDQHISVAELSDLLYEVSKFRKLAAPEEF